MFGVPVLTFLMAPFVPILVVKYERSAAAFAKDFSAKASAAIPATVGDEKEVPDPM
jgi:hypothetical protein